MLIGKKNSVNFLNALKNVWFSHANTIEGIRYSELRSVVMHIEFRSVIKEVYFREIRLNLRVLFCSSV